MVVIVSSTDDDTALANEYGWEVFEHENKPLGRKFNAGLEHALESFSFDYLMQINSDNILSTDFWEPFKQYFAPNVMQYFFGVDQVYFYDSDTRGMRNFRYAGGCGIRFIRRDIVERAGYNDDGDFDLWTDEIDGGLDNDSSNRILKRTRIMQHFARHKTVKRPVVVDVKSEINIHSFSEFRLAKGVDTAHREQVMRRFPELRAYDERMRMPKGKLKTDLI